MPDTPEKPEPKGLSRRSLLKAAGAAAVTGATVGIPNTPPANPAAAPVAKTVAKTVTPKPAARLLAERPLAMLNASAHLSEKEKPEMSRVYEAFEAQDKVLRIDIRRASGVSHCPSYAYLLDIIYGPRFQSSAVLVFSFMTVTIKGRNLRPVVDALKLGKAATLREFHPELYDAPAEGAPVITMITVTLPKDRMEAAADIDGGNPTQ